MSVRIISRIVKQLWTKFYITYTIKITSSYSNVTYLNDVIFCIKRTLRDVL